MIDEGGKERAIKRWNSCGQVHEITYQREGREYYDIIERCWVCSRGVGGVVPYMAVLRVQYDNLQLGHIWDLDCVGHGGARVHSHNCESHDPSTV